VCWNYNTTKIIIFSVVFSQHFTKASSKKEQNNFKEQIFEFSWPWLTFPEYFVLSIKKVIQHCTIISTNLLHIGRNVFPTLIKIHLLFIWYLRFCDTLSKQGNKNKRITVANSSMNLTNLVNHSLLFFVFVFFPFRVVYLFVVHHCFISSLSIICLFWLVWK
jgi:hypothetical protein